MKILTLPNHLTILRLSLIPVFVFVFYLPWQWSYIVTATIFAVAGLTDWLDGYLARKLQQESTFGRFLDPVADKLVVSIALCLLIQTHATALLALPGLIIIGREITISALRELMAELGKKASTKVSWLGKVKTVIQMVAIVCLLSQEPPSNVIWLENKITILGYILLYLAVLLTLWSMIIYLKTAWKEIIQENESEIKKL